jgi:inner membrane protein
MDSLTHLAIGALIGEAYAGKRLGRRALLFGAIYQSIPDVDFISAFFLSPTENFLFHRGFTHSFLFGILMTVTISFFANRWRKVKDFGFSNWVVFVGLEIFVHLLLDGLNACGVGWLEPFWHQRFAYNVIFVIDPMYSIWLGISCTALLLLHQNHHARFKWVRFGLAVSSLYLCFCLINKVIVDNRVEHSLLSHGIQYKRYLTTPTALNNLLWHCVAESDSGYHVGYSSIFDRSKEIKFQYFPRNESLLASLKNEDEVKSLLQFSNGFYTVERLGDGLLFNDLRFGRIAGWERWETEFTFHYYLQQPTKNRLVVQRGRFAEWNWATVKSLVKRIRGK